MTSATKYGGVAFGTGITGTLIGLAAAHSAIFGGNQIIDSSNNTNPRVQVYDSTNVALIDTIAYAITGTTLYRPLNFVTNGTQSGITLKDSGLTGVFVHDYPCTNSGGLAKYQGPCVINSPFATTGALKLAALVCGGVNKTLSMSGGFVKTAASPVTSALSNLRTISVGSGAGLQSVNTGATLRDWNPADKIKFQTVTPMPAGGIDCKVHVEAYDRYGT